MRAKVEILLGSTAREVGILILVFAPLESFVRGPEPPMIDVTRLILLSLILIGVGITLEARAERKK